MDESHIFNNLTDILSETATKTKPRNLKIIINKHGFNMHALLENMKEALKIYELYGKNMDMEDIKWRGWLKELREYLDKPCNRKIIWVVGVVGNEGKSFFQRKKATPIYKE